MGSETHYARAFDWRNYEYTRKPLEFSNTEAGFQTLKAWVEDMAKKHGKTAVCFVYPPPSIFVPDTEKCPSPWLIHLRYKL